MALTMDVGRSQQLGRWEPMALAPDRGLQPLRQTDRGGTGRDADRDEFSRGGGIDGVQLAALMRGGSLPTGLDHRMAASVDNERGNDLGRLAPTGRRRAAQSRRPRRPKRARRRRTGRTRTRRPSRVRTSRPARTRAPDRAARTRNETGIPNGLRPNAAAGARLVREMGFRGEIGGIGHRSGPSDHPHGNAIDVMTHNNTQQGREIAERFRREARQRGVKYVIYQQQIASPRTGWQWQRMPNRGSPTANHMDHVHVSFH
jgi:hypothetical protein